MINVDSFSGLEAEVTLTFQHACEHKDYSRVIRLPIELATNFTAAENCPADGATMLICCRINSMDRVPA